ncbi:MAG: hypothetical protein ACKVT0_00150 [Planctomycetaceae bacterium]
MAYSRLGGKWLLRLAIRDEFDADHDPLAANLADVRMLGERRVALAMPVCLLYSCD